jgi:hypothetical protein
VKYDRVLFCDLNPTAPGPIVWTNVPSPLADQLTNPWKPGAPSSTPPLVWLIWCVSLRPIAMWLLKSAEAVVPAAFRIFFSIGLPAFDFSSVI